MPRYSTVICKHCGQAAIVKGVDPLYCSKKCYDADRRAQTQRTCLNCGKMFYKKSQGHHGLPVYCSITCQAAAKTTRVQRTCDHCGKTFECKPSRSTNRRHCSRACQSAANVSRVEVSCLYCGSTFSVIRGRQSTARFCSRRCKAHYHGETAIERDVRLALTTLGIPFKQEHPVGRRYCVDFYLFQHAIALEVDGVYWHKDKADHDTKRDTYLASKGITTVRISDAELKQADALTLVHNKVGHHIDVRPAP